MGSPFPEDAKLCAALNSFWPAAAPDAGRTFGRMTGVPLLDDEIGLHPDHPKVRSGAASSSPGWDGEFGPFFSRDGKTVNFASIRRSDYSSGAFHGRMSLGLLGQIETAEQLARMDAFRECADRIRKKIPMTRFQTVLVTAEKVADWSERRDRFDSSLTGPGYLYVFADLPNAKEDPGDMRRMRAQVKTSYTCQVTGQLVGLQKNGRTPNITRWLHPQA